MLDSRPAMQNPRFFDDISARVSAVLANSPAKDLEKNLRANLSAVFTKLELVTREEFDIQAKVLERTREKLARLEAQLVELEKKLKP
jgi:BMFP domain-containing protein YqiC